MKAKNWDDYKPIGLPATKVAEQGGASAASAPAPQKKPLEAGRGTGRAKEAQRISVSVSEEPISPEMEAYEVAGRPPLLPPPTRSGAMVQSSWTTQSLPEIGKSKSVAAGGLKPAAAAAAAATKREMEAEARVRSLKNELSALKNRSRDQQRESAEEISALRKQMALQRDAMVKQARQLQDMQTSLAEVIRSKDELLQTKDSLLRLEQQKMAAIHERVGKVTESSRAAKRIASKELERTRAQRSGLAMALAAISHAVQGGSNADSADVAADNELARREGQEGLPRSASVWAQLTYHTDEHDNLTCFSHIPGSKMRPFDLDGGRGVNAIVSQVARLYRQRQELRSENATVRQQAAALQAQVAAVEAEYLQMNAMVDAAEAHVLAFQAASAVNPPLAPGKTVDLRLPQRLEALKVAMENATRIIDLQAQQGQQSQAKLLEMDFYKHLLREKVGDAPAALGSTEDAVWQFGLGKVEAAAAVAKAASAGALSAEAPKGEVAKSWDCSVLLDLEKTAGEIQRGVAAKAGRKPAAAVTGQKTKKKGTSPRKPPPAKPPPPATAPPELSTDSVGHEMSLAEMGGTQQLPAKEEPLNTVDAELPPEAPSVTAAAQPTVVAPTSPQEEGSVTRSLPPPSLVVHAPQEAPYSDMTTAHPDLQQQEPASAAPELAPVPDYEEPQPEPADASSEPQAPGSAEIEPKIDGETDSVPGISATGSVEGRAAPGSDAAASGQRTEHVPTERAITQTHDDERSELMQDLDGFDEAEDDVWAELDQMEGRPSDASRDTG